MEFPTGPSQGADPASAIYGIPDLAPSSSCASRHQGIAEEGPTAKANAAEAAVALLGTLRPWSSFLSLKRPDGEWGEVRSRVVLNLVHFQANYMLLVILALFVLLFSRPWLFIEVGLMVAGWNVAVRMGVLDQSSDTASFAGTGHTGAGGRVQLLVAGSLFLLYLVAGKELMVSTSFLLLLAGAHAALHPGAVDVRDFMPIDEGEL